ncbi:MAG: alpha/beta hydrolase [Planctomycetia bacterium]|nr:alpha/beta hydrolase [Planctomycetia bacterium]
MPRNRRLARDSAAVVAALTALFAVAPTARGDSVVLNNGIVYRGTVDRDKPLLWVYDGLKRVALRDSKVRKIESDASYRNLEVFKLEQPLVVHAGAMPREVIRVAPSPWNDRGRRAFAYEGSRPGKVVRMEQAINEMGPYLVKVRGVDGYWQSQLATTQVPRDVILGILAKVEQKDRNERIRVARFLIQAEWYPEARAELDRILKDFPGDADLAERVAAARASVLQLEAVQTRAAIDRCRLAQQPREASALLKSFPSRDVAADLDTQVRELRRTAGRPGRGIKIHRVRDDENDEPTEYTVSLPPEYHPLRSYPAVVALHDGGGMESAVGWWSAEAAKRGYIVVAPEYKLAGQGTEYHYSGSEHAAVELALRDAKRRYAIDSDRVFVGGQLVGANMAWDFGLAHPDLFAGAVVVSGLPFKYVNRYLPHTERLPLYVAIGDLAPAASELVYGEVLKPLIAKAFDVTYVEYLRRGLEDLPEEAPAVFDWMDRRRRDPYPKKFEVVTARPSDNRFYGVVVRDFQPGRTMAPEAVDGFGKNLNPATLKMTSSNLSNLVKLETTGVKRLDVWLSPRVVDFGKKMEVRINSRSFFKGQPKPDLEPLLEDLRIRGDREQIYWMKVSAG